MLLNFSNKNGNELLGDVLFLLKLFQKTLQGEDTAIVDIVYKTQRSSLPKSANCTNPKFLADGKISLLHSFDEEDGTFLGRAFFIREVFEGLR